MDDDDFLSLTTAGCEENRWGANNSTSWTGSGLIMAPRIVWDEDHPSGYETKVFVTFRAELTGGTDGEVRLVNDTEGREVDRCDVTHSDEYSIGPKSYSPANPGDLQVYKVQMRLDGPGAPGDTITVYSPLVRFGIGVA